MQLVLWIAAAAAALFALDRLFLWLEARGWLYYRKTKKRTGGLTDIFLGVESFANPAASHAIEAREQKKKEAKDGEDESGRAKEDQLPAAREDGSPPTPAPPRSPSPPAASAPPHALRRRGGPRG